MAAVGDPCTTPDGRSGYLVASGDDATGLVCQVSGPGGTTGPETESFEFYKVSTTSTPSTGTSSTTT